MKNKKTEYKKEKKQLKFNESKQLVLFIIMTCVAFFGLMIILVYLSSLINKL